MSHFEPNDRFDVEWPHVLERELDRIPLPPRRARARYMELRRRAAARWRVAVRPALAASLLVAVIAVTSVVLSTSGRLPVRPGPGLPGASPVQQEQNGALQPVTAAPIAASLDPLVTAPVGSYSYSWPGP